VIDGVVREAAGDASVAQANVYLSGLDLPVELETFAEAIDRYAWTSSSTVLDNDLYALLRSGTSARDAVAVVCGTGINAIGTRADGAVARFAALGLISGDWGGGGGLGEQALWHAARDADRRGPHTTLTRLVPAAFGLDSVEALIHAIHLQELASGELSRLSPVVMAAADAGDEIAASLIDRQGREIALMAISCIERLGLTDRDVPVVLGGGVLRSHNARLMAGISAALAERTPLARVLHVAAPPIVGAALLALESAGATATALERARTELLQVASTTR
jgi:N-acetylglucosamine kinase-like BadF-type ATPase